jgi:hypothetical protein
LADLVPLFDRLAEFDDGFYDISITCGYLRRLQKRLLPLLFTQREKFPLGAAEIGVSDAVNAGLRYKETDRS